MSRRYPERPIVGVGALVIDREKVLLVRRATEPLKGVWSLPGGVVEAGETLNAALEREVFEEAGLTVTVGEVVAVVDHIDPDAAGRTEYHYILIDYLCRTTGGELRPASDVDAAAWFSRADLETVQIQEFTRELILRHLQ